MIRYVETAFNTAKVSEITGVSSRQLAYWDRIGLLQPSFKKALGKGSRRLYSLRDLVELTIIARLLDSRVPLQRIRKSFSCIRSLSIPLSELEIVSNGHTIYACKTGDFVVDTLRHGQTVLKLVVADLMREVEERAAAIGVYGELSESGSPVPAATSRAGRGEHLHET